MKSRVYGALLAVMALVGSATSMQADDTKQPLDTPGYRLPTPLSAGFLSNVESNIIAVLPAIMRSRDGMDYSVPASKQGVKLMQKHGIGTPIAAMKTFDTSAVKAKTQGDAFKGGIKALGEQIAEIQGDKPDYFLIPEFLISPTRSGAIAVGGMHCYIIDGSGANAFSFLLNSHHAMFVEARLRSEDTSTRGKQDLVRRGTSVMFEALNRQIKDAR